MSYIFLAPLLPPLELYKKPDLAFEELFFYLRTNLSQKDIKKVALIQAFFDVENIRNFWLGRPFLEQGAMDEKELEENIAAGENGLSFVREFLEAYPTHEERVAHFDRLISLFFAKCRHEERGFLGAYFDFEYKLRLFLGVLKARTYGMSIVEVLRYEPADDPFVQEQLLQKDSNEITPPEGFERIKKLYDSLHKNPLELARAILHYKMDHYLGEVVFYPFSKEAIFSYVIRFFLVEKSLEFDVRKGKENLDHLTRGVA
jgi:hypothetical protein